MRRPRRGADRGPRTGPDGGLQVGGHEQAWAHGLHQVGTSLIRFHDRDQLEFTGQVRQQAQVDGVRDGPAPMTATGAGRHIPPCLSHRDATAHKMPSARTYARSRIVSARTIMRQVAAVLPSVRSTRRSTRPIGTADLRPEMS